MNKHARAAQCLLAWLKDRNFERKTKEFIEHENNY